MKRLVLALTARPRASRRRARRCLPSLTYDCRSESRRTAPVGSASRSTLKWDWHNSPLTRTAGTATSRHFTADTPGTNVYCEVRDDASGDITGRTVTIRVDRTAPSITDPGLAGRPTDNDWFNHPVEFQLAGQDATSGVESCTGGTYGGPDGAGVSISGSCRDVAGNVTTGVFTLNYDATAPPQPTVAAFPGNHRVALSWSSAQNEVEIVRRASASSSDGRLPRGNRKLHRHAPAQRTPLPLRGHADRPGREPERRGHQRRADRLPPAAARERRAPEQRAHARLEAREARALLQRAAAPRPAEGPEPLAAHDASSAARALALPGSPSTGSVRGHYCWYVWPGFGPRSKRDYGRQLGKSCFTVTR